MKRLRETLTAYRARFGEGCAPPEYRRIAFAPKTKDPSFPEPLTDPIPTQGPPNALSGLVAFSLLDAELESRHPALEGLPLWRKYLALPRQTTTDKLVAEVYRILRIYRTGLLHADGRFEIHNGSLKIDVIHEACALSLWISPAGMKLLEAFVHYYLDAIAQPYSDAYVEAMLTQLFLDIVNEIKKFADLDRVLYQFRRKLEFNRHFRFDCDNPKVEMDDQHLVLEIGERHQDKSRFPIDFLVVIDNVLHIIPVEALTKGRLPRAELDLWTARTPDGVSLPAEFKTRFAREQTIAGLPMT
jgi:hypothetical protein